MEGSMLVPRFTVRGLMLLVAGCGAALMMLMASNAWTQLFVTAIFVLLGVTTLAAIYSRGERRAFWIGFTFFTVGYFVLLISQTLNNVLVTQEWLVQLAKAVNRFSGPPQNASKLGIAYYAPLVLHGHFVCALVAGICGGVIARALRRRLEASR
jgi:hypothetical protein